MRQALFTLIVFIAILSLQSCGMFGSKSSSSSSSVAEFSSSSVAIKDSNRAEINYGDTLQLKDSVAYVVKDTVSGNAVWDVFIGKLPKGSVIHLGLLGGNLSGSAAKFRVKNELGAVMLPTDTISDGSYQTYAVAGDSTYVLNHFPITDTGYYYLEIQAKRSKATDSIPDFKASLSIDTAYYQFTGKEGNLQLPANQDLQGFILLSQDSVASFHFSAEVGVNLTLVSRGQNLNRVVLYDSVGHELDSAQSALRQQLLPQAHTSWQVKVTPMVSQYNRGNYAFFTLTLNSIKLGKGEYFANPDTMLRPGDTMHLARQGTANSGWDVRHDHYLWLGTMKAGDSLWVWYGMEGLANVTKTLSVLDAQGNVVSTLGSALTNSWSRQTPAVFVAPSAGDFYLHYEGLGNGNTYWIDPNYTLHLQAMVQKPGSVQAWSMNPPTFTAHKGDVIYLDSLVVIKTPAPATASMNYVSLIPRSERSVIKDSIDIAYAAQGSVSGDAVLSGWVKAVDTTTTGVPIHLIVQSVADPDRLDTCLLTILP